MPFHPCFYHYYGNPSARIRITFSTTTMVIFLLEFVLSVQFHSPIWGWVYIVRGGARQKTKGGQDEGKAWFKNFFPFKYLLL